MGKAKSRKFIQEGTGKIDPIKKPKTIDATAASGENKGETLKGIYEIEGDAHKVCFARRARTGPPRSPPSRGAGSSSSATSG